MSRRSTIYEDIENKTYKVRAVFGPVKVSGVEYDNGEFEPKYKVENKSNIENYLMRELNVARDVLKTNRYLDGLTNPEEYLNNMNIEKVNFIKYAADEYNRIFKDYFRRGYTTEEAENKALKAAKEYYNMKLKQLSDDYPSDVTGKLIKKLSAKVAVK